MKSRILAKNSEFIVYDDPGLPFAYFMAMSNLVTYMHLNGDIVTKSFNGNSRSTKIV